MALLFHAIVEDIAPASTANCRNISQPACSASCVGERASN
jgi:hypothetical protein